MRWALALLVASVILAPGAGAIAPPPVAYPSEITSLVPGWVQAAQAFGENNTNRQWYREASSYLEKAQDAAAQGRVRVAIFDLETYRELVVAGMLIDKSNASFSTSGEQKAFIVNQLRLARSTANDSWLEFRRELHADDAQIHSLRAVEIAIYAADVALIAKAEGAGFDALMDQFIASPGIERGYILGLVHGAQTVSLEISFARDILSAAGAHEGLPPRILDANWTKLATSVTNPAIAATSSTGDLEALAHPARLNGEVLLSLAFSLAEQRAERASAIQQIYGDAKGRVGTVLNDLSRYMGNRLANTTLVLPRSYGLQGVFTADATDRASYAKSLADEGQGDMGSLMSAWAGLDHSNNTAVLLGSMSPVQPTPPVTTPSARTPVTTPSARTPDAGLAAIIIGIALVAMASTRRR